MNQVSRVICEQKLVLWKLGRWLNKSRKRHNQPPFPAAGWESVTSVFVRVCKGVCNPFCCC